MEIIEVNEESFAKEVLECKNRVLIDFNANWCGPCRMLRPILDEYANEHEIKIVSVNIDDNEDLANKYQVTSIPCLVLINNGIEEKRSVGLISKDDLSNFIGE